MGLQSPRTIEVPTLHPHFTEEGLPEYSHADLRNLAAAGFARLGTVAALIASNNQYLMFRHKGADKGYSKVAPGGAWGFAAETAHYSIVDGQMVVESSIATFQRGFSEEGGMDPRLLRLRYAPARAFTTARWPVGYSEEHRAAYAFAVVPIMHFSSYDTATNFVDRFQETVEIDGVGLFTREELGSLALRNGVEDIINTVESSGLKNPSALGRTVEFPDKPLHGQDIIFASMPL